MKTRIVCLALAAMTAVGGFAQKKKMAGAEPVPQMKAMAAETKVAAKTDAAKPQPAAMTEECQINISLFSESAKQKNYADALGPWEKAYANCKGAHRAIYTYGVKIVDWQISQEKDSAKREALIDKLMAVYDEQILYFGDYAKQPRTYLLGMKAKDLLEYRPTEKQTAYEWLSESVHGLGNSTRPDILQLFVRTSFDLYKEDNSRTATFIADYSFANDILERNAADKTQKYAAQHAQVDAANDQLFATSGAADCNKMDELYGAAVEKHKADYDYLASTVKLFEQVDCDESKAYFAAAKYAHNIKPTAESAKGCAEMSYKSGNYGRAVEYFAEAAQMNLNDGDSVAAANNYLKAAHVSSENIRNNSQAREYARKAIAANPDNGTPYLFIGLLYANTKGIYEEPILNKSVFWAAVDKFIKAKQVDPSLAEKANELIRTYSQYFPTKEQIFFVAELEDGKPFTVGGWIGETTICR